MLTENRPYILLLLSTANVAVNLVLQFACVLVLGVGSVTDAYFSAQTVPLLAATILAGGVTNNLTPMAAGLDETGRTALVRDAMLRFSLLVLALFGLLAAGAAWWVPALFSGLAKDTGELAIDLARLFSAVAAMQVLSAIGIAGQYAQGRFVFVEAVQLLATVLSLAFAAPVIEASGILGFGWLLAARAAGVLIISNFHFVQASSTSTSELLGTLWTKTLQIMSASIVFKMGPVVDRMLASFSPPGVLTSLGVGQQLVSSSLAVSERVMARPLLVAAGKCSASDQRKEILSIYYRQLRVLVFITAAGLAIGVPLALVLMQGDKVLALFEENTWGRLDLLFLMALTTIPAAAGQLSAALMYALGNVKTINRLAMVSFVLSTSLKVLGFLLVGAYAIVAGIFLYQGMNWLLLHLAAVRELRAINI